MLAATGRTADVQGLGLENLGVALSRGGKVDTRCVSAIALGCNFVILKWNSCRKALLGYY